MPDGDRDAPPHAAFPAYLLRRGYSAAYYSYLWSEVLDADGFEAFEEAGDIFDPEVAQRLHDFVYAAGGSREPDEGLSRLSRPRPRPRRAAPQARAGRGAAGRRCLRRLRPP